MLFLSRQKAVQKYFTRMKREQKSGMNKTYDAQFLSPVFLTAKRS
jgi:hypothetical protein